jgi:predicted glycosyltransferase
VRVWIDIENPPQVQYLLPFKGAFEAVGASVVVTARDYDFTYALLDERGVPYQRVGTSYGAGKVRKIAGLLRRTRALRAGFRRIPKPSALLSAGRASTLAAWSMRVPTFAFTDYEFTQDAFDRLSRAYVVLPEAIDRQVYLDRGFHADRLISYRGLKEDLTFAGVDLEAVRAHRFEALEGSDLARVLFRPPAEESHYYREESGTLALATLEHLAGLDDAVMIYSPRYAWQVEYLRRYSWANEPVVLERAVPFLELLEAVDAVISAGGTMLREAAYVGVPAYSIFRGVPGGVDAYLASLDRLRLIGSRDELAELRFRRGERKPVLRTNPRLLEDLVELISERVR